MPNLFTENSHQSTDRYCYQEDKQDVYKHATGGSTMKKKVFISVMSIIGTVMLILPNGVLAGNYPSRTIQMTTQIKAGNPAYAFLQVLANEMGKVLGQKIVTNALPGASGVKAARSVLAKPADGYNIFDGWVAATVIAVLERPNAGYTYKDFIPLGRMNTLPLTLIVKGDSELKTLDEFVEYAKKNPGMTYACSGDRTIPHALLATFFKDLGIKVRGIPYPGIGAGVKDLLGGTLDFSVGMFPLIKIYGDKIRTLCVFQDERHQWYPDIPTAKEFNMDPGFGKAGSGWNALYVKKGTPPDRVEKLQAAFKQVMASEEFRATAEKMGFTIDYVGPEGVYALAEESMIKIKRGLENVKWEKRQFAK